MRMILPMSGNTNTGMTTAILMGMVTRIAKRVWQGIRDRRSAEYWVCYCRGHLWYFGKFGSTTRQHGP